MLFNTGKAKQLYTAVHTFDADVFDEHPSWAERIIIAVAIALAVVIVTAVGVLLGVA
jgi:hypothetical protein